MKKVFLSFALFAMVAAIGTSAYAEGGDRTIVDPTDPVIVPLEGGDRT